MTTVIAFTSPTAPRSVRLDRALHFMQTLLGETAGPNDQLYLELAERYDVTKDELVRAWIKAGLS